jgi:CRP/FNR family transcriptional regulator, cyclic AMP receptor protein
MDLTPPSVFLNDSWFGRMAPEHRTTLLAAGRIRSFRDQQRVYRLGDPPNGLYGLISGDIRLISYPVAGRQLLVLRLKPGEWFGELSTIDGGPRPQDAVSFGLSKVLHISSRDFERVSWDNPEIFRHVARLVGQRQRAAVQYAGMIVSLPVKVRLSHLLLAALDASEKPLTAAERTISLTQSDIAAALGVSRQTTNKLLKLLEQTGGISLGYGLITVLDTGRLRKVVEAS